MVEDEDHRLVKVLLAQGELVAARHEEATALGGADLVRPGLLLRECGILAFQKLEVGSGGALDGVVFGRARGGSLLAHEHSAEIAPVALERGRDVVLRAGEERCGILGAVRLGILRAG